MISLESIALLFVMEFRTLGIMFIKPLRLNFERKE
jgi:hypothetical protein